MSRFQWLFIILRYRCTVVFKFFWGDTWGCKKILGVPYFRVLYFNCIFWSLLRG
jgi:hypothetical protein